MTGISVGANVVSTWSAARPLLRPPNADLHPAKHIASKRSLYRPNASMAAVAALHAHA